MPVFLFYLFSAVTLGFALLVVLQRNPVTSAMSLVVSFAGLAALFISLDAYFIGILQILIYAGAVMVLFLFIIMLFDIRAEERRRFNRTAVVGGAILVLAFTLVMAGVLSAHRDGRRMLQSVPLDPAAALQARAAAGVKLDSIDRDLANGEVPDVKLMGETLFTRYNFHLQVMGVLLLCATAGVIILSRREDRQAADRTPPGR